MATGISTVDNAETSENNSANGLYVKGAQVEAGSFVSSYIPTTSAAATRAADLVTLAGTAFPLNQTEGTLYAKWACAGVGANPQYSVALDDGTAGEIIYSYRSTGGLAVFSLSDSADQIGSNITSTATVAALAQAKIAAGYKLNDCAGALIGETVRSDNVCTMPTTTKIVLGNRSADSARALNGWLFEAMYLPIRRTNSQLQALASGYASDALLLMGAETQGLTFSASDQSMSILDTTTAANNYTGELSAKLGSIRTSAGMTYLSSGLLGWGPENLALRSQQLDQWGLNRITVSANVVTAPDGTLTADKIVEDNTASNTHFLRHTLGGTNDTLAPITFSIYLKAAERSWARLVWNGTSGLSSYFNIATGALGTSGGGAVSNITSTPVGDGWFRCSITVVPTSSSLAFEIYTATGDLGVSYSGDNTSGIYAWGAQFERASSASTYKPTTSAAYYGLRLDYDSRLTGGPGYLIEEARTNLVTQSNALTNAAWTATRSSVAATETGMDGTTSAFFLKEDATAASSHHLYNFNAITVTASTNYCLSAIVKQKTGTRRVRISVDNVAFTSGFDGTFNFASPANPATGFYGTATVVSSGYQDLGNGYYRIWIVGTLPTTTANVGVYMHNGTGVSYDGDNTSGFSVERFQFELGSFPSSYIPTTTASVTRARDDAKMSSSLIPSALTVWSMYTRFTVIDLSATHQIMSLNNGTNDRMELRNNGAAYQQICITGGSTVMATTAGTITPLVKSKLAARFRTDDLRFAYSGGSLSALDNAGNMPTSISEIAFGQGVSGGNSLGGWLHEFAGAPANWNDATLQAKTA